MNDGRIKDSDISASSIYNNILAPAMARSVPAVLFNVIYHITIEFYNNIFSIEQ